MTSTFNKMSSIKIGGTNVNKVNTDEPLLGDASGVSLDVCGNVFFRNTAYMASMPYVYNDTSYVPITAFIGTSGSNGADGQDGISFIWKGAYSGATAYVANDVVSYGGSSYICILASTGNLPTNTTYWNLMSQKGDQGIQGIQGVTGTSFIWRGAYSGATAYVVNDVVSYNGSSYVCILASTGNLPTNTTYWNLVAQKGDDGTGTSLFTASGNNAYSSFSGDLGLGTTTPSHKLDVSNNSIGAKILYLGGATTLTALYGAIKMDDNIQRRKVVLQQSSGVDNGFQFVGMGTKSGPIYNFMVKDNTWDFNWCYATGTNSEYVCMEYTTGNNTFNVNGNMSLNGTNLNSIYGRLGSTNSWTGTNTFSGTNNFTSAIVANAVITMGTASSRLNQTVALTTPNQLKYSYFNGRTGTSQTGAINDNGGLHVQYNRTNTDGLVFFQSHPGNTGTGGGFVFQRYDANGTYVDTPFFVGNTIICNTTISGVTANITTVNSSTTKTNIIETNDTSTKILDVGYDTGITDLVRINGNRIHMTPSTVQLGTKNNLLGYNETIITSTALTFPLMSMYNLTVGSITITLPEPSINNSGARVCFNKATAFSGDVTLTLGVGNLYAYNTRTNGNIVMGSSDLFCELICDTANWYCINFF